MLDAVEAINPRRKREWEAVAQRLRETGTNPVPRLGKDLLKKFQRLVKGSMEQDSSADYKRAAELDKKLMLTGPGVSMGGETDFLSPNDDLFPDQSQDVLSESAVQPKRPRITQQMFLTRMLDAQDEQAKRDSVLISALTTATQALARILTNEDKRSSV